MRHSRANFQNTVVQFLFLLLSIKKCSWQSFHQSCNWVSQSLANKKESFFHHILYRILTNLMELRKKKEKNLAQILAHLTKTFSPSLSIIHLTTRLRKPPPHDWLQGCQSSTSHLKNEGAQMHFLFPFGRQQRPHITGLLANERLNIQYSTWRDMAGRCMVPYVSRVFQIDCKNHLRPFVSLLYFDKRIWPFCSLHHKVLSNETRLLLSTRTSFDRSCCHHRSHRSPQSCWNPPLGRSQQPWIIKVERAQISSFLFIFCSVETLDLFTSCLQPLFDSFFYCWMLSFVCFLFFGTTEFPVFVFFRKVIFLAFIRIFRYFPS